MNDMVAGTRRCIPARSFFMYSSMPVVGQPANTEKEERVFFVSGTGLGGDTPREDELQIHDKQLSGEVLCLRFDP